jgi:hypothetical protein
MIYAETKAVFRRRGYRLLRESEAEQLTRELILIQGFTQRPMFYKQIGGIAYVVGCIPCNSTLLQKQLQESTWWGFFWGKLADWRRLPACITRLTRRRVKVVRRVWLFPILRNVPEGRIGGVLTKARKLGNALHYYWPSLADGAEAPIKSSSELLVIDGIKSTLEYNRSLSGSLAAAEAAETPIVIP